jgi:hypothetical protein
MERQEAVRLECSNGYEEQVIDAPSPQTKINLLLMKTNFASNIRYSTALLATLMLGSVASVTHAAPPFPPSPVFTNGVPAWDIIVTGAKGERGVALLTFTTNQDGYGNYSFDMRQIHTKIPTSVSKVKVTQTNAPSGRSGSTGNRGDTVSDDTTSSNLVAAATELAVTNIFGYIEPQGSWGFDYKGRILGFYVELLLNKPGEGTNPPSYFTNQVSFIGKVTPNKRFTALYSSSIGGNGKYAGVPQKQVTNNVNGSDFSGPWTGEEILGSRDTVELFTLLPGGFRNAYDIIGDGPGYTLDWQPFGFGPISSKCIVSCQKKIAFTDYKFINATNATAYYLRATIGTLKNTTKVVGGNTTGLLSGSNVVYNAYFVPFVPYP